MLPPDKDIPVFYDMGFTSIEIFVSEQIYSFQMKVEDAIFIVEIVGNIHPGKEFLKEVSDKLQGVQFKDDLFFSDTLLEKIIPEQLKEQH